METRQVTQVKIYKLWLHDIRRPASAVEIKAIAYDKQKLIDWYNEQLAPEEYQEEVEAPVKPLAHPSMAVVAKDETTFLTKYFKKESHIEWYDKCDLEKYDTEKDLGINEGWTTQETIDAQITTNKAMYFVDPITAE